MEVFWSEKAVASYEVVVDFIFEHWPLDVVNKFGESLDNLINKLRNHQMLCPESKIKHLRKCLISKQTSLIYRIKSEKTIEIVLFIDNRSNHKY